MGERPRAKRAKRSLWEPRVCEQVTDLSDRTLRWALVLGVGSLAVPGRLAAPAKRGNWTAESCRALAERVARVGMRIGTLVLDNPPAEIVLGNPGRDEHVERVIRSVQAAGTIGCPVVEYSFSNRLSSRASRRWPAAVDCGSHTRREMLARIRWLLEDAGEGSEPGDSE